MTRNLAISWGLHVVDALLLMLCAWEVWNFELWEQERVAKRVPGQDWVGEEEQGLFWDVGSQVDGVVGDQLYQLNVFLLSVCECE